jgi:protease IV
MKRFLLLALASVGALVIVGFVLIVFLFASFLGDAPPSTPDRFVLELDLTRGIATAPATDPFSLAFDRGRLDLTGVVSALHRAADDDRVLGLRVKGGSAVGGWAVTDELRDAVVHFGASGKPTQLFAETFGELAPAQGAYHLATAFDEIVLQPSGEVGLAGLSLEAPFVGGLLDRYDVETFFEARGEYKDAVELFTRTGFSGPSREALEAVLRSLRQGLVEGIAEGRSMPADSALALLAAGPFSADQAVAAGLVDRLGYADEAVSGFDARVDPDRPAPELADPERPGDPDPLPTVGVSRYLAATGGTWSRGTRVAIVHGTGTIERGSSPGFDPLGGGSAFAASRVASHLREAAEDPSVRAIIFRVDSPGGSWVASDVVRREVVRAREAGIPVVVSMGNAAASGGYLVSVSADRIVAHPSTLTGSIGVVAGRVGLDGLLARYGITFDAVDLGDAHAFYGLEGDLAPEDLAWLEREVDRIYGDFVELVAEGRGMTRGQADEAAQGRVWTGRDALDQGLVDALGGLPVAVAEARELAGLEPDAPVELRPFPAEKTLFELFMDEARGESMVTAGAGGAPAGAARVTLGAVVRGAVRVLARLGQEGAPATTRTEMPPLRIPGS